MIRFTQQELDVILADFLGRPWERYATGPDAYDCYGLARAFMDRIGVQIPEIGKVDPADSRPVYERQQSDYIRLNWPRPWSMVTFSNRDLDGAHIGVVLPGDNLFLHCPGRAAGKVIVEPLSRRPWRDHVDGYWWPRGYIEAVILLTPMTTTKRAWQFVRAGRCLAEIVEQDITESRDIPVQVFLDGELIEKDDWLRVVPTELQQIVVRPLMGEGEQALMMVGMLALAVFAPYAAGAIVGKTAAAAVAAGTATAGQTFAYNLAAASVMMAGGLALNALVGASEADREVSQHYTWDPQTTQRVGSLVPLVYGTYGVRGNILCAYATSEYVYETNLFNKTQQIRHATELYHTKIAYSDGPIEGVIDGTEKINDRSPEYYADSASFTVEHFRGTDDQAASSIPDAFEVPVGLDCATNQPATTTFTAVDCDSAALVLRFSNGFTNYEKDGGHKSTNVTIKAEIRIVGGAWHTLMNGNLWGDSRDPMRINLNLSGSYTGGSPFALVTGTRYEAKITRLNSTHSDRGDSFLFECVQFRYNTAQKLPGIAYTAIGAAASREISGSIQYYAKIKGKLVRVYRSGAWYIEWSDNPAWIAYDLLTRPVIRGNGTTIPYSVEYYQRLDPGYLVMADFVAFAAWCDEWVPDGNGGTEKRYVFNGVFDADGSAWDQAIRVCQMACAMPYFKGHRVGIVVDKPGTPSQMFNVSNLRGGFAETWIDNSEAATVYDVEFADELADYAAESYPVPLLGAARDIPASLDGFGHTKRSQVWRRASRQLRINQHMRRTVEIPACLDAIWSSIGDIVYVQHPALQRASGGRIGEVYADGVKLDKPVVRVPAGALAHYRFNDNAASTAVVDSSGNARNATASQNTSVLSVPGKLGGAFQFGPNLSRYVQLPNDTALRLTSGGHISLWINWAGTYTSSGGVAPRLFSRGEDPRTFIQENGAIFLRMSGTTTGRDTYTAAGAITPGVWTHLVFAFGADKRIYVNGVDRTQTQGDTRLPAATGVTYIGSASATTGFFDGQIDDVRIYAGIPTLNDVQGLYNRGLGTEILPASNSWALLVRTHDGVAERLNLYSAASVSGDNRDIVTINGVWEYTPNPNDLWTFGEESKVIDLYRIKSFERTRDGQVLIQGTQYMTAYYDDDDVAPRIQAQVYSTNKGGKSPTLLPTTAEAIKAALPDGNSELDSLVWEGLAFTGDGSTTVTWTCQGTGGAGIKYRGTWCPIFDDVVGTTKRWVYFDPAIGDPRYLQATDNINDLAGQERYVFCENVGGLAFFKPGILIGADQIKLDGIEEGATNGATWGVNIADQPPHLSQFFYQNDPPSSGMNTGDYWLDTNDGNKLYRYNGSTWTICQDSAIQTALTNAATAQATADGKIKTYFQTTAPASGMVVGDLWFDTDDNNKPYRYSGSAWTAAAYDAADWAKIFGAGKPASYADVTADSLVDAFIENFENANGDYITRWTLGSYTSGVSIVSGVGVSGGKVLRVTNRADAQYYRKIPYDPSKMYRIRARARTTSGTGQLYLGLKSYDAAGAAINLSPHTAQWFCVGGVVVPSAWTEYTGYFTGLTGTVQGTAKPSVSNPGALIAGTAYFTIFAHINYNTTGVTDIDEIAIDIIPENADLIAETSTKKWAAESGADVTRNSAITNSSIIENFDDRDGMTLTRWPREYGPATFSLQTGGVAGGKVLRVVAPDGQTTTSNYSRFAKWIPYDPSKLYRIRFRVRAVVAGKAYLGVAARNTGDTGWLSYDGNTSWGSHWIVASNVTLTTDWTVYTGYLKGHAAAGVNGTNAARPDPNNPGVLRAGTGYVHPFFIVYTINGQGVETGVEFDEISIDVIPEDADQIAESTTKKWAGESGADVTRNSNIATGLFHETFENPLNDLASRWVSIEGSGELAVAAANGVAGGKVLQVGNNSGVDNARLTYYRSIPYDPSKMYRLRVRARRTAGTGTLFVGIAGRDATDTAYVNYAGNSSNGGYHWIAAYGTTPTDWTVYTAFFKGTAATGSNGGAFTDPANPAVLHQNVRYIRPLILPNSGASGIYEIDEVTIDIVPEDADQIAESSTKKWAAESGATVGATWGVNITNQPASLRQFFYQNDPPSSGMSEGDYWIDTNDGNKLYRYSGSAWVEVRDTQIAQAIADAATALATADGKILTFCSPTSPAAAVHCKLNDNAATNVVADSSGNGRSGAATANTSLMTIAGKVGTALRFVTAESRYVVWPDDAGLYAAGGGTISLWLNWDGTYVQTGGYNPRIFSVNGDPSLIVQADGSLMLRMAGSTGRDTTTDPGVIVAGQWVHVVALFGATKAIYVNGVNRTLVQGDTRLPASAGLLRLGAYSSSGGYLGGDLDDLRVFTRILSESEIRKIYNGGAGTEDSVVPAVGDLWMDSDDNNRPYRWSGSAWTAVDYDVATWSKIVGTGKPADYADVTANSPIAGGVFLETFEDLHSDYVTRWGITTIDSSIQSGGLAGGKFVRCGDNSGNDRTNLLYYKTIPYDPDKLYRLKIRARTTAGTGRLYAGIYGYDSAGVALNPDGASAHWICAVNRAPAASWTTYTCYFKGHSTGGSTTECPVATSPGSLRQGVSYFAVRIFTNYSAATGIMDIDEVSIDVIPESADLIAESATKKWAAESGADVTSTHAGDINYTGPTAPPHQAGRLWLNTDWCGKYCVGHWRLNDNGANKFVKDESAYCNHGTACNNTMALSVAGKVGTGLTFDASNWVTVATGPVSLDFGTGDYTLTAWIKTTSATTQRIMAKRGASDVGYDWYLLGDGRIGIYAKDVNGGVASLTKTPSVSLLDGNWHFVAFRFDRDGNANFYVDGALLSNMDFRTASASMTNTADLLLGKFSTTCLVGAMDNAALFTKALSKDELDALYDAGTGTEQICLGSSRALLRSDGTRWLLADSDSPTIPRTADEIGESTARKWAAESGADVTAHSNVAVGAFLEIFDDPSGNFASRWTNISGTGEVSIVSGGLAGGKVLQVGNNSGDDMRWYIHNRSIPFDPNKLYRIRVRARQTAGTALGCYFGVHARDAADAAWVAPDGSNSSTGCFWVAAAGVNPGSSWVVYTGYLKGTAAAGINSVCPSPDSPAKLHTNARYIRPVILCNYYAAAGTVEIDEVSIDIIPDGGAVGTDAIAPGAVVNYAAAYTDEFAMLNTASGEVDMQSITITTNGLPVVVQYGATVQYGNGASSAVLRLYRVGAGDSLQTSTIIKAESGDDKGYFSAHIHTPAAGTYTYKFTSTGGSNWVLVGKRFLSVTEFKR